MRRLFLLAVALSAAAWIGSAGVAPAQQMDFTQIFGGRGGDEFTDFSPPAGSRVVEVRIYAGDTIDSLQMIYSLPDGRTTAGSKHGGRGGNPNTFRLDADEYITGISGRFGNTVDSLRFHTNRRTSPNYGGRGGSQDYRAEVPSGYQAMGFKGRAGNTIDAIGLVYSPASRSSRSSNVMSPSGGNQTTLAGGRGGNPFSDRPPQGARLAEIRVRAGDAIDAIQAIYVTQDGRIQDGQRHGGGGGRENIFRLDSGEYVVGLSGRFGKTVDSLRIETNRRSSPLYGGRGGSQDYRIDVPAGTLAIGFVGRSGKTLDAVGLNYDTLSSRDNPRKAPWQTAVVLTRLSENL